MIQSETPFHLLPTKCQAELRKIYGIQPHAGYSLRGIAYARALSPQEARFFDGGGFPSPGFLAQAIYKLQGPFTPMQFNRALNKLFTQDPVLRTAYCEADGQILAVVFRQKDSFDGVLYQRIQAPGKRMLDAVIQKISVAEFCQPFNLARAGLARFVILHTGEEEYAVMVTGPQIVLEQMDVQALLRSARNLPEPEKKPGTPPVLLDTRSAHTLHTYWKSLFASPPPPVPPPCGLDKPRAKTYKQQVCRVVIPEDVFHTIQANTKGNRMKLAGILATAWGFLLQKESGASDLCFFLGIPAQNGQAANSWVPCQMIPMRHTNTGDELVGDFLARQVRQFLAAQAYASFTWKGFGELLGRKDSPPDHFLDFYDFLTDALPYADQPAAPDGNLVARHAYAPQGMKLGIYFRYEQNTASVNFIYDANAFHPDAGGKIAAAYLDTLRSMASMQSDNIAALCGTLSELPAVKAAQATQREESRAKLLNAISSVGLLQTKDLGAIQFLMKGARLETYFEGDSVPGMDRDVLFLVDGMAIRSIQDDEGWYCPVGTAKKGTCLNETLLLQKRRAAFVAAIVSEKASILAIPLQTFRSLLHEYPGLWENIAIHALTQMEAYQKLWSQT